MAPLGRLLSALGRSWALLDALGRSWEGLSWVLGGWGGSGEGLGWFLQQASSSSSSKAVPYDRACFGLLGHAFAR